MFFTILVDYLAWHYHTALVQYVRILKNFWWFVVAYFSLPLLVSTFFSPYRRLTEAYTGSLGDRVAALVINILSRGIGMVVRSVLLVIGIGLLCVLTIGGVGGYALWLVAPVIPSIAMLCGVALLVS